MGGLEGERVVAAVGPANGWAPGTVRTLITRLLRKKALAGSRGQGGYLYRPLIARALLATRGNQLKAADVLGLNRNTLRKKIRDLDIQVSRAP